MKKVKKYAKKIIGRYNAHVLQSTRECML